MKKENQTLIMIQSTEKQLIRAFLNEKRATISNQRRSEASNALFSALRPLLNSFENILSFHSFNHEIDTSLINHHMAQQQKLHLPKVFENTLLIFSVDNLNDQLEVSYCGKLSEPMPLHCRQTDPEKIDCVLVPGLGFDRYRRRIGYGKGHYDRLILQLKQQSIPPLLIGIGFKEQLVEENLPFEKHDQILDQVLLL